MPRKRKADTVRGKPEPSKEVVMPEELDENLPPQYLEPCRMRDT